MLNFKLIFAISFCINDANESDTTDFDIERTTKVNVIISKEQMRDLQVKRIFDTHSPTGTLPLD